MSITELMQRAENKDPQAMFDLAEAYFFGENGVDVDDEKAFALYKELETLTPDNGTVLYRLGECHMLGLCVDKSLDQALEYFWKAAEKGSGIACWKLGMLYKTGEYVPQDLAKSVEYLNKGARARTFGSDDAAITLGDMYHYGDGVGKDEAKACELYRIAAKLGNADAYYRLGMQTFNGWGTEADKAKGMEYWKKGAELGHAQCMYITGKACLRGTELPQDTAQGLAFLEKAAEFGLSDAHMVLGSVYLEGLCGIEPDENEGLQHFKSAAKSGNVEAMVKLGDYYLKKYSPDTPNQSSSEAIKESAKWYEMAAEKGVPYAAHQATQFNSLFASLGADPEARQSDPLGYILNREEWKKAANYAQLEIDLLQQGNIEGKEALIEQANSVLSKAKYEQAICCYVMDEYADVISLLSDVEIRDSRLLSAVAQFYNLQENLHDKEYEEFAGAYQEVATAFSALEEGGELEVEEEKLRATAALLIADGYKSGIPGVLPQDMRLARETLEQTRDYLSDEKSIIVINEALAKCELPADHLKKKPADHPPKTEPDRGDKPKPKKRLYALIALAALAIILIFILANGKKDHNEPSTLGMGPPAVQVTDGDGSLKKAAVLSSAIEQYDVYDDRASHAFSFQYEDDMVQSCCYGEDTLQNCNDDLSTALPLYRAEFRISEGRICSSALYENEVLTCEGVYDYSSEGIVRIHYSFLETGEEGNVQLNYEQDGNSYSIVVVPDCSPRNGYPSLLPEQLGYIYPAGSLSDLHFGYHTVAFDYEIDPDTQTLKSLRVTDLQSELNALDGWYSSCFEYNPDGAVTSAQWEWMDSEGKTLVDKTASDDYFRYREYSWTEAECDAGLLVPQLPFCIPFYTSPD